MRKSEVSVKRISVCNVTEKLMEYGIHCLPCSYTYEVIDLLALQLLRHIDFKVCHSVKVLSTTVGYSIVAMTLWYQLTYNPRGAWHTVPCSPRIISEMILESHAMEKCDFLKPIIHSQII